MADPMFVHEDNAAIVASFQSLVQEVSDIESALLQIAFEQDCSVQMARTKLERLIGNLEEFVSNQ